MTQAPPARRIRSFVRREGRMTAAQKRDLETLWPRYGLEAAGGVLDWAGVFGRNAPRLLEIGFGNGEALFQQALAHPERDHVGVEVHRPGVGRLLRQLEDAGLANVRVFCADAVEVLAQRCPAGGLQWVLTYFPDPWPKKRHHKRRLVQPAFADLVARVLAPGGEWRLATDWADYATQMRETLNSHPEFANLAEDGGYQPGPGERPLTRFERRGLKLGHEVFDLAYRRRPPGQES